MNYCFRELHNIRGDSKNVLLLGDKKHSFLTVSSGRPDGSSAYLFITTLLRLYAAGALVVHSQLPDVPGVLQALSGLFQPGGQ